MPNKIHASTLRIYDLDLGLKFLDESQNLSGFIKGRADRSVASVTARAGSLCQLMLAYIDESSFSEAYATVGYDQPLYIYIWR